MARRAFISFEIINTLINNKRIDLNYKHEFFNKTSITEQINYELMKINENIKNKKIFRKVWSFATINI